MASNLNKAIFMDVDGVIRQKLGNHVDEKHPTNCVVREEQQILIPEAITAFERLRDTDYKVCLVSNQCGIGMGYATLNNVHNIFSIMVISLRDLLGREVDWMICPHHPDESCFCKKPRPGMILNLGIKWGVSSAESWMIGDNAVDIDAGKNAGIPTKQCIKIGKVLDGYLNLKYAPNLNKALDYIL
jgi:D-glycero-D-manno-heptose 1,7-bisphosphate phosphatase